MCHNYLYKYKFQTMYLLIHWKKIVNLNQRTKIKYMYFNYFNIVSTYNGSFEKENRVELNVYSYYFHGLLIRDSNHTKTLLSKLPDATQTTTLHPFQGRNLTTKI